jgi:hypothetical protein
MALLTTGSIVPLGGKPPDLPVNETIDCREITESCESSSESSDCIEVKIVLWPELMISWNVLHGKATVRQGPAVSDTPITCPYLKDQEKASIHRAVELPEESSVLDNLAKLQRARLLIRKAERLLRTAHWREADGYLKNVIRLCPGSRYAVLAQEQRRALQARMDADPQPAEEENSADEW